MGQEILLNPGPVNLSDRVRNALTKGDWCHREPEFAHLTQEINSALASVYEPLANDFRSVVLTGSGTSSVEAMLATFAHDMEKTLVVANGVYGERMARMLAVHDKPHVVVQSEWSHPMDLEEVRRHLETDRNIGFVVAVHHETTTGRLNDIAALGKLCHEFGVRLLIDAVSSFGAEYIAADDWNIAAIAGTANKCLHGVPGLSFVLARNELWADQANTVRSVYLDLRLYYQSQHEQGYSPFTQAVQVAFALNEALSELQEEGGWQKRRSVYRARAEKIYRALASAGIETVLPSEEYSCVLRSYQLPATVDYGEAHDQLKFDGFVIYAGQGQFASTMFRIANMGAIGQSDLERLCAHLIDVFGRNTS